jgi:hypothetical protein
LAQGKKNKNRASGANGANKTGSAKGGITGLQIGLIVAAVIIVIGGASAGVIIGLNKSNGSSTTSGTIASNGIKLPDYAYDSTAPKGTAEAYQFAVNNPDVLKYIPCYCGCGELDGHTSNLDCFIKSGSGNNIVFDKHAAG